MSQSVEKRQLELLGVLLENVAFREWVWSHIGSMEVFHDVAPENPIRMAWLTGRRSPGLKLLGDITASFPTRYASMLNETAAWRAQREARDDK